MLHKTLILAVQNWLSPPSVFQCGSLMFVQTEVPGGTAHMCEPKETTGQTWSDSWSSQKKTESCNSGPENPTLQTGSKQIRQLMYPMVIEGKGLYPAGHACNFNTIWPNKNQKDRIVLFGQIFSCCAE